jgi:fumarate hydratase class II
MSYQNLTLKEEKKLFPCPEHEFPKILIYSYATIKLAAARANLKLGLLKQLHAESIEKICLQIMENPDIVDPVPLYSSGSGTTLNMAINRYIAEAASKLCNETVHPNDHVNLNQSSNDTFPATMHLAVILMLEQKLFPAARSLMDHLYFKASLWSNILKVGRTHLQDALPVSLGDEFHTYAIQLQDCIKRIETSSEELHHLPLGGTAVGNGLNCHNKFPQICAHLLEEIHQSEFDIPSNKSRFMAAHDAVSAVSAMVQNLSGCLFKIAADLRLLTSGPDCGIGELSLPVMEAGSSIMPGKVNPTQLESVQMICTRVMGLHHSVLFASSQGNLELNTFKPIIAASVIESVELLSQSMSCLRINCLDKLQPNNDRIKNYVEHDKMIATLLTPRFGYDTVAKLIHQAREEKVSLKEVLVENQLMTEDEYSRFLSEIFMNRYSGDFS